MQNVVQHPISSNLGLIVDEAKLCANVAAVTMFEPGHYLPQRQSVFISSDEGAARQTKFTIQVGLGEPVVG